MKRRERKQIREAIEIEEFRLGLFELDEGEVPLDNVVGYLAVAWPTITPPPNPRSLLPSGLFLGAHQLEKMNSEEGDAWEAFPSITATPSFAGFGGTSLRFVNVVVLVTSEALRIRLLGGDSRSTSRQRYAVFEEASLRDRKFPLSQITEAVLEASEPDVLVRVDTPLNDGERAAATGEFWLYLELSPSYEDDNPRWPKFRTDDVDYLGEWLRESEWAKAKDHHGLVLGFTALAFPPQGLGIPSICAALRQENVRMTGEVYEALETQLDLDDWEPIEVRLAAARRELAEA
ncbi:MAG: hypothetical protein IH941_01520 [Acidobacteria bacterium]|nr:hypothetical protein [Acidobacteriota bacterium]